MNVEQRMQDSNIRVDTFLKELNSRNPMWIKLNPLTRYICRTCNTRNLHLTSSCLQNRCLRCNENHTTRNCSMNYLVMLQQTAM